MVFFLYFCKPKITAMNIVRPSIPKGTRDFTPSEMMRRNYILDTIRTVFCRHAYLPIETPALENLSTLMGKYGEEGDRLLFKILNSGDFTKDVDFQNPELTCNKLSAQICEKGLRYDLTVPFARFVVQHQNEITFPFKRYQIQPVWRADRPQKGRYREFYQCDADIIGSTSLLNETELIEITDEIFTHFGIIITIKLNNRKILSGIAEIIGAKDKLIDLCTAMDKLDKIGQDGVCAELTEHGICEDAICKLTPLLCFEECENNAKIERLKCILAGSEMGMQGLSEICEVLDYVKMTEIRSKIVLDVTLARGLNYYTGTIFEVKARDVEMGSISGGGRYDDLTGIFGLNNMSGVGISYGAERIYDVLSELSLFPAGLDSPVKVLFIHFDKDDIPYSLAGLRQVRAAGISAELYPDNVKIGKQMSYANAKSIPFVIMAGENERRNNVYTLKDMNSGKQRQMNMDDLIRLITA